MDMKIVEYGFILGGLVATSDINDEQNGVSMRTTRVGMC